MYIHHMFEVILPISAASCDASLDGFMRAVNMAASCVETSAVLPLTPVRVAKAAMSSSIETPRVLALAATFGSAWASWLKEVTPFFAVIWILSCIPAAASHSRP